MAGRFIALALLSLLILHGPSVHAQTARQSSGGAAQAVRQLQQLAAERTQLTAENVRLKQELEATRKELAVLKSGGGPAERRLRAAEGEVLRRREETQQLMTELEQQRARLQELIAKSREIIDTLRAVEKDRAGLRQQLAEREQSFNVCADRNLELFKLNDELLVRLERRSVLARVEPFTQISRARLQNLIEDYRFRAEEQRVSPTATPSVSDSP